MERIDFATLAAGPDVNFLYSGEIFQTCWAISQISLDKLDGEFNMTAQSLLVVLIIGAIAGWLAGLIVRGAGFGLIGNIVVGIIGAFVASWVLPRLGVGLGSSALRDIINATIGGIIVLVILSLIRRV